MKEKIHPEYFEATVYCGGCGSTWTTGSTIKEIRVNVCSNCHPFYTGKQKLVDTEGRVDRFKRKYAVKVVASKDGGPSKDSAAKDESAKA